MMVTGTHLLLLACIIAVCAGLSCDDVTCCPGWVCEYRFPGESRNNLTKCVEATSCDQLDCPSGYRCVNESQGPRQSPKLSCQPSCAAVSCPDFLQCVERDDSTECVIPSDCSLVECPPGTSCQEQKKGRKTYAMCIGESCNSVDCFDGSECVNVTVTKPLDFLKSKTFKSRSKSDTTKSKTEASGDESGSGEVTGLGKKRVRLAEEDAAICVPSCEDGVACPPGLVCDMDGYHLVCREPESCDELECPVGQVCEEVRCEHGRGHAKTKSSSRRSTGTKTKTRGNTLVQCVDVDPGSGPEDIPTTETSTEPEVLARVESDEAALLSNSGAHSLFATAVAFVLPISVFSLLYL